MNENEEKTFKNEMKKVQQTIAPKTIVNRPKKNEHQIQVLDFLCFFVYLCHELLLFVLQLKCLHLFHRENLWLNSCAMWMSFSSHCEKTMHKQFIVLTFQTINVLMLQLIQRTMLYISTSWYGCVANQFCGFSVVSLNLHRRRFFSSHFSPNEHQLQQLRCCSHSYFML